MPRAYSADLRGRGWKDGRLSRRWIANLFGIGPTTLFRRRPQARQEGRRAPKSARDGPAPRLDAEALEGRRSLVAEAHELTLAEYAAALAERTGLPASAATLCRALKKLGRVRQEPSGRRSGTGPSSSGRGPALATITSQDAQGWCRLCGYEPTNCAERCLAPA